jgi:UDP-N-acetylglucosamine acyltransferase
VVGNHTTMANNATLAGHVEVGDWVTVGGLTGHPPVRAHRRARHVGFASARVAGRAALHAVDGNPLAVRGVNLVGLRRRDFLGRAHRAVKQMHKLLYRQGKTLDEARAAHLRAGARMPEAAATSR